MDQRAIIDVVCKTGIENLATEIGALLGRELTCDDVQLQLSSKEAIFSDPGRAPTALTRMTISGDKEGDCFLLNQIDSAITLGGTLIMLPEDMIEEHIQSGKLDGELNDAFGEVANIIAGVFTQAFVDKYPKSIRFIKQTVEDLIPTKIDLSSTEPFPPGTYYVASCQLIDGEKDLGPVEFIVPAAAFDLDEATVDVPAAAEEPATEPTTDASAAKTAAPASPAPAEAAAPKPVFADAKKLTDAVFNAAIGQICEEIGALLGQELACDDIKLLLTSKADFFADHCTDKATMADLKVSGDREGCGFMFTHIPDAIILGGTLIMLPEDQIEEQVGQQVLEGEAEDAFGEVANILAGGLTQVFLDRYPKQLRFVRTESTLVTPTKIDLASDEPFPEGDYYLASFSINTEGKELNRLLLLFPAHIFDLDGYQDHAAGTPAQQIPTGADSTISAAAEQPAIAAQATDSAAIATATASGPPLVLIISEQTDAAQPFAEILSSAQYECKVVSFQEDIKTHFQQNQVLGVILLMSQVNEKGFAAAIKLQSSGQTLPPLIFAGPEWTRSTVLRAVKYGALDILVMPASDDEIGEKISQHFRKAS